MAQVMENVYYTRLSGGRRVAIPAEVCEKVGLNQGDPLEIRVNEHGLQLIPFDQVIQEVQQAFAPFRKSGVSMVDVLIRERREEAAREDRE